MSPTAAPAQHTFTSGEHDPRLVARVDIEQHYTGASKLRNVRIASQGSVERRPGSLHVHRVEYDDVVGNDNQLAVAFNYPGVETFYYSLLFINDEMLVTRVGDDSLLATVALPASWSAINWEETTWFQSSTLLYLFNPEARPQVLSRTSHTAWTFANMEFRSIPQQRFADTVVAGTNHVEEFGFVNFPAAARRYTVFVDGVETAPITYDAVMATNASNLETAIEALPFVGAGNCTVAFIASSGGVDRFSVTMNNAAGARFWSFGEGETVFDDDNSPDLFIRLVTTTRGSIGREDAWSAARGWPRCGCVFQGAFYLAGTDQLPLTLWRSRVLDFTDFVLPEEPLDDSPFIRTADVRDGGKFVQCFAGQHLHFFTDRVALYVPLSSSEILTPATFMLRASGNVGAAPGLPVFDVEGSVFFVQADGRAVREVVFSGEAGESVYTIKDVSLLSPHLLGDPIRPRTFQHTRPVRSFAVQRSRTTHLPNYLYVVNEDKSMAILAFNKRENVTGWSLWVTGEDKVGTESGYMSVCVPGDTVFTCCNRPTLGTVSAENGLTVERFDEGMLFDNGVRGADGDTETEDMTWLEPPSGSVTANTYVDGRLDNVETFVNGQADYEIEFTAESEEEWMAGLTFPIVDGDEAQVWVQPLPPESKVAGQPFLGRKRRIAVATFSVFETRHFRVNGRLVSMREYGSGMVDASPPLFTGIKVIRGLLGWSRDRKLDITQTESLQFTLLGLVMGVGVGR